MEDNETSITRSALRMQASEANALRTSLTEPADVVFRNAGRIDKGQFRKRGFDFTCTGLVRL